MATPRKFVTLRPVPTLAEFVFSPPPVILAPMAASDVLRIDCAAIATPFGWSWLATSDDGICALGFPDPVAAPEHRSSRSSLVRQLAVAFPHAELCEDEAGPLRWWNALQEGQGPRPVPLVVNASAFCTGVWQALLGVSPGAVTTYGALAESLGLPGATRAVGTAIGRNPISWLIPCHRVVPSAGDVGQYRWGSERKRLMLAWESRAARALPAYRPHLGAPALVEHRP